MTASHVLHLGKTISFLQVLSVDSRTSDTPVMYVWDGTDALPLPFT